MHIHATTVCDGKDALMIVGASGSGKSTLALQLIRRGWWLVADDVSVVTCGEDGGLSVSALPEGIGLLEVRGLGLLQEVPNRQRVALKACFSLETTQPPRLPLSSSSVEIENVSVRQILFWEKDSALLDKVLTAWDVIHNRRALKVID